MQIIPVIDVRHGLAVRAVRGDRSNYRPIVTPLSASADPVDVARGYMRLFPFKALYIADLDGIEGRGANFALHERIVDTCGGEIWIDDGSIGSSAFDVVIPPALALPTRGRGLVQQVARDAVPPPLWGRLGGGETCPMIKSQVLGSESLANGIPAEARSTRDWILSLDFRGDEFQGPRQILDNAATWPDRVIVMTLARVGANEGPDLVLLKSIIARAGPRQVFAAGGVRGRDDLLALRDAGAAGVLIASALHDGKIKTGDLEEIAGESL